jgi:hypothetical protein
VVIINAIVHLSVLWMREAYSSATEVGGTYAVHGSHTPVCATQLQLKLTDALVTPVQLALHENENVDCYQRGSLACRMKAQTPAQLNSGTVVPQSDPFSP